jgi:hypothetical protein
MKILGIVLMAAASTIAYFILTDTILEKALMFATMSSFGIGATIHAYGVRND